MRELKNWQDVRDFLRRDPPTPNLANGLASKIAAMDSEVARFLASGMLDYLACRLGGHCHCGKALEERECVALECSLLPALDLSIKHWGKTLAEGREKVLEQIRKQFPDGMLIADAVAREEEDSEHLQDFLADLMAAARLPENDELAASR
jgi:hypothetical protein